MASFPHTVAFIIHDIIHFRASCSMAEAITSQFNIQFFFLDERLAQTLLSKTSLDYMHDSIYSNLQKRLSFEGVYSAEKSPSRISKRSLLTLFISFVRRYLPQPIRWRLWRMLIYSKRYWLPLNFYQLALRYILFNSLIKRQRPDVLILNQADPETNSELYISIARRHKVATVINPFTFCSKESVLKYFSMRLEKSRANWFDRNVFYRLFPQWFDKYEDNILMRAYPAVFVANALMGLKYRQPWKQDYSSANAIIADSAASYKHYMSMEFPKEQVQITGEPEQDILSKTLKNKKSIYKTICHTYGFDPLKALVLIALPPEDKKSLAKSEFSSFKELIKFITSPFIESSRNVLLCPHPRFPTCCNDFVEHHNIKIAVHSTFELVALCDLYISFVSVTVKWANFCAIPTINYDVYSLKDFSHLESKNILTIYDKEGYLKATNLMVTNAPFYKERKAALIEEQHLWGVHDGTATKKTIDLLNFLAEAPPR